MKNKYLARAVIALLVPFVFIEGFIREVARCWHNAGFIWQIRKDWQMIKEWWAIQGNQPPRSTKSRFLDR